MLKRMTFVISCAFAVCKKWSRACVNPLLRQLGDSHLRALALLVFPPHPTQTMPFEGLGFFVRGMI